MKQSMLCKISMGQEQHTIVVKLDKKIELTSEAKSRIRQLVVRCVTYERDHRQDFRLNDIHHLSIERLPRNEERDILCTYEISGHLQGRRVAIGAAQQGQDVQEVVADLSGPVQMRRRSIVEIKNALLQKWPSRVPVISFIWQGLVRPLVHLIHAIHPGHVLDLKGMTLIKDPHGEQTLISALQEVRRTVFTDETEPLARLFDGAVEAEQTWKNAPPARREAISGNFAQNIADQFRASEENPSVPLMMIPTGYWDKEGKFQPVLMTFSREGNHLRLTEAGYGAQRDRMLDFEWNDFNPDHPDSIPKLSALIQQLMVTGLKPAEQSNSLIADLSRIGYLTALSQSLGGNFPLPQVSTDPQSYFDLLDFPRFRENLILNQGFEKTAAARPRREVVTENPFLLIHETLRQVGLHNPMSSKLQFTYALLERHVETVLHHMDKVSPLERLEVLRQLDRQCESLERQYSKMDIEPEAIRFGEVLGRLRAAVVSELENDRTKEVEMERLNEPVQEPFHVAIDLAEVQSSSGARVAETTRGEISAADLDAINRLKQLMAAPTGENVMETHGLITSLTERCDQLVERKCYPVAIELYRMVMSAVPVPTHPDVQEAGAEITFWEVLDQRLLNAVNGTHPFPEGHKRPFEVYRELSSNLERLNHYFWESKVKINELKLTPTEWIDLIKTELGLVRIFRKQNVLVNAIQENQRNPTERAFHSVHQTTMDSDRSPLYHKQMKNFFNQFLDENFLSLSQSHDHQAVLRGLRQLLDVEAVNDGGKRDTSTDHNKEMDWISAEVQHDPDYIAIRDLPIEERERINKEQKYRDEKWKGFLYPSTYDGERGGALSQLSEIRRHHLVLTSFMNPETSIQPYCATAGGAATLTGHFLKTIFTQTDPQERIKATHRESLKELRSYPRLEFSSQSSFWGSVKNYGVVPKGVPVGTKIQIELNTMEVAFLVSANRIPRPNANDYSPELGNPNKGIKNRKAQIYGSKILHSDRSQSELAKTAEAASVSGNSIELTAKKTMRITSKNGFDSTRNTEEVIDKWIQRPDFLDDLTMYRRFYEELTRPFVIYDHICKSRPYFNERKEYINQLITEATNSGNICRATRLYYFSTLIGYQFDLALKNGEITQAQYDESMNNWPTFNSEAGLRFAIEQLQNGNHVSSEDKFELATSFLIHFYAHPMSNRPGEMRQLFPDHEPGIRFELIAALIKCGAILEHVGESRNIPINAKEGKRWVREQLVPYLIQNRGNQLSRILEHVLNQQTNPPHPIDHEAVWTAVEGHPRHFRKEVDGVVSEIDLATLQVVKYNGQPMPGIEVEIPYSIRQHPHYQNLFGEKVLNGRVQAGRFPGESIFTLTEPGKGTFRITVRSSDNSIVIERQFLQGRRRRVHWFPYQVPKLMEPESAVKGLGFPGRFLPQEAKDAISASDTAYKAYGLEEQILQRGVFVDPKNPRKGFTYLSTDRKTGEFKDRVIVTFDKQGKLLNGETEGKRVIHAPGAELERAIGPLGSQQLLYLAKLGKEWVSEIRFVGQGFSLQRESKNGPWILRGHPTLEGAELQIGQGRSPQVRQLLLPLGTNFENCGLVLRKDNKDFLFLWPHQVVSSKAHKEDVWNFEKTVQEGPPLVLELNETGDFRGSSTAFMTLAYLFAAKHEYEKAVYYLQRSVTARIGNQSEVQSLRMIDGFFRALPTHSLRSNAVALKGLLAVRRIIAEQVATGPKTSNWREFLDDATVLADRYQGYLGALERSPFAQDVGTQRYFQARGITYGRHLHQSEKEFTLTEDERNQLDVVRLQSLLEITPLPRTRAEKNPLTEQEKRLSVQTVSQEEMRTATTLALITMKKPCKSREALLEKLRSDEGVVDHFFELWNLIIEENMTPDELLPLFFPTRSPEIESLGTALAKGERPEFTRKQIPKALKVGSVELARRALITLAAAHGNGPQPYDVDALADAHSKLPSGLWSLALKGGWLVVKLFLSRGRGASGERELLGVVRNMTESASNIIQENEIATVTYGQGIGPVVPIEPEKQAAAFMKDRRGVDIYALRSLVATDRGKDLFGPDLTSLLRMALENLELSALAEQSQGILPLTTVVEHIEKATSLNMIEFARIWQNRKRIMRLESPLPPPQTEDQNPAVPAVQEPHQTFNFRGECTLAVNVDDQLTRLGEVAGSLVTPLKEKRAQTNTPFDGVRETEKRQLVRGIKISAGEMADELRAKRSFTPNQLETLSEQIQNEREYHSGQVVELREMLFRNLENAMSNEDRQYLPKALREAMLKRRKVGDEPVWRALRKSYQMGELSRVVNIDTLMTQLLLHETSVQVLDGRVSLLLNELKMHREDGAVGTESGWMSTSTQLLNLLESALNHNRYFDNERKLLNPSLYRKVLVMEASKGIILTEEQLNLIMQMVDNPTDWYELKVGLGKTSVVFPLVLLLLIERGESPTAVVKDALLHQNLDSLDADTREIIEGAGVAFTFSIFDPCSALSLQETYMRLLEVKNQRGYTVTTSASLLGIEQKLQLLRREEQIQVAAFGNKEMLEELYKMRQELMEEGLPVGQSRAASSTAGPSQEKNEKFEKYKELLGKVETLDDLQQQMYYLSKIRTFFELLIVDEVDDVLDPVNENNVGLGDPADFPVEIRQVLQNLFTAGMRSIATAPPEDTISQALDDVFSLEKKRERLVVDPEYTCQKAAELFRAISSRNQASLDPEYVKQVLLPALLLTGLSDEGIQNQWQIGDLFEPLLSNPNGKQRILDYFCGSTGVNLFEETVWENLPVGTKRLLEALKHQLQQSLPIALNQNPGIDFGTKEDGYQIGPRVSGQEKDAIFGASHDILSNHFVSYLGQLPNTPFFLGELKKIDLLEAPDPQNRLNYQYWKNRADQERMGVIDWLNRSENWDIRLYLLEKCVVGPRNIKIFDRQIVFNVQDIAYGRRIGGMTGTCNRNALPPLGGGLQSDAKKVTGRVLLEAALLGKPTVEIHQAPRSLRGNPMFDRLKAILISGDGSQCRAIINQGFDLEVASTEDVIRELRESTRENAPDRIFVYIDSNDRLYRIWYPNEEEPRKISKEELNRKMKDSDYRNHAICYFAPPDTRGTDVRLPGGYAVAMVSEKCSEEDMVQLLGRMRSAGQTQHLKHLLISEGVADRIGVSREDLASESGYGHVVMDILNQTIPAKASKNLKASSETFKRETGMGVRGVLHDPRQRMDQIEYWSLLNPYQRILDGYVRKILGEAADEWLYESKAVDFDADRPAVMMENTENNFEKMYRSEREKIDRLFRKFEELARTPQVLLSAANDKNLREIMEEYARKIEYLSRNLEERWKQFQTKARSERPVIPASVPSLSGGMPMMNAQVQQQQQVQQQVQVQQQQMELEQVQEKVDRQIEEETFFEDERFRSTPVSEAISLRNPTNRVIPINLTEQETMLFSDFWNHAGIRVSLNWMKQFCLLDGFKGSLINCRMRVTNDDFTMISARDYHYLKRDRTGTIFTAVPTHLYPESGGFLRNCGEISSDTQGVRQKLLLAKLFMGVDDFTEDEQNELRAVLQSMLRGRNGQRLLDGLLIHARHFGGARQFDLINNLLAN